MRVLVRTRSCCAAGIIFHTLNPILIANSDTYMRFLMNSEAVRRLGSRPAPFTAAQKGADNELWARKHPEFPWKHPRISSFFLGRGVGGAPASTPSGPIARAGARARPGGVEASRHRPMQRVPAPIGTRGRSRAFQFDRSHVTTRPQIDAAERLPR